ncbi:MAG: winged helix DNA-binding domain-containing protein [Acidimicrobiales bacterium]
MAEVLSGQALNRATLARQLLLRRSADRSVLDTVHHLVGMQAQVPLNPYLGLWSRLDGFRPEQLSQLLLDRKLVRIVVMRGTIHLVTADDCLLLRPLVQPVLDAELRRHMEYGPDLRDADFGPVLAYVRPLLAQRAMTGAQLRAAIAERFPDLNAAAFAYACRNKLAFVQVPPRGVWGRSAQVASTTAEAWLGRPLAEHPAIDEVVLRYFGVFGPASVADVGAWSRLTGLREVVERLRPRLVTFRDERGRELFDLPDAPRPDPGTPAPVRFLPEYDNVLLSHDDRSRFASGRAFVVQAPVHGSVLSDGCFFGTWSIARAGDRVTLVLRHGVGADNAALAAVEAEGLHAIRFLEPDAVAHHVRLEASGG